MRFFAPWSFHSEVSQAPQSFDSAVSQAPRSFDSAVSQAPPSHLKMLVTQPKNEKNQNGPRTSLLGLGGAV